MNKLYIPPILMVYCILTYIALFIFFPAYNGIKFPYNLIGLFVALRGLVIMGKARALFRKHKTTVKIEKSDSLVTEGVFSKTRNPMYVGMFILLLGFSVVSTNFISLIFPFIFLLLVQFIFVAKEEILMEQSFGSDYLNYKNKTRRWI